MSSGALNGKLAGVFAERIRALALCLGLLLLALAQPAHAERLALVIGNSTYTNADMLPNPEKDVAAVGDRLKALGFDVTLKTNQSIGGLRIGISAFRRKVHEGDTVLIYYAGHGMEITGRDYMIPIDADIHEQSDVDIQGYDIGDLFFTDVKNVSVILIFDACRDNAFVHNTGAKQAGTSPEVPPGRLAIFSAASNNQALDGDPASSGAHSVFANAVIDSLRVVGANETDFARQIVRQVVDRTQGQQVPHVSGVLDQTVVLNGGSGAPAAYASAPPPPTYAAPPAAPQAPPMQMASADPAAPAPVVRSIPPYVDLSGILPAPSQTPVPPDNGPYLQPPRPAPQPAPAPQAEPASPPPVPVAPPAAIAAQTAPRQDATAFPELNDVPRAGHAQPGAFTIAAIGYKTLPPRPALQPAPDVKVPPSFCSLKDRNKFHEEVYSPARTIAYANNEAAVRYITDLDILRREYQSSGNAFYVLVVKESQDYKRTAEAQFDLSEHYRAMFDTLMDRPIIPCG